MYRLDRNGEDSPLGHMIGLPLALLHRDAARADDGARQADAVEGREAHGLAHRRVDELELRHGLPGPRPAGLLEHAGALGAQSLDVAQRRVGRRQVQDEVLYRVARRVHRDVVHEDQPVRDALRVELSWVVGGVAFFDQPLETVLLLSSLAKPDKSSRREEESRSPYGRCPVVRRI